MIEIDLYTYLKNDTAVKLAVGTNIFPMVAKEGVTTPYIIYTNVSDVDQTSFQGDNYSKNSRFQLDIYSPSYGEVKEILGVVKDALYNFGFFPHNFVARDLYEKDTKLFRQLIEFNFNN